MRIPFVRWCLGCATVAMLLWMPQTGYGQAGKAASPGGHELINQKAIAVKSPDKAAIAELVDAVVSAYPVSRDVIGTSGELHDQLVLAELAFHNGNHKGVSETDVARILNRFAALVEAPPWAYTNESEVRRLRATMLISSPAIVGMQPASQYHETPHGLTSRMSPAESVLVLSSLVFQKLHNPEWQLTPEENKSHWMARHSPGYKPDWADNRRSVELQQKIDAASSRVSLRDIYEIAQQSFAEIEKGEERK